MVIPMEFELEDHTPSESAKRRAAAAGLDIEVLKREEPFSYMMLCALPVLDVEPRLKALARPPLEATLDDQQLFEAEAGGRVRLLAFPGPGAGQLRRLDELMGQAIEGAAEEFAYYRVVQDRSGTRRELDLPTAPVEWQGRATMVGPFPDEDRAREWGQANIDPRSGSTYDAVPYAGGWFCDVFSAADIEG